MRTGRADRQRALADVLNRHHAAGIRVVFASDMYLPAGTIAGLIGRLLPQLALDGGYSSADLGVTKRGGGLFKVLLRQEQVEPGSVLHMGDSETADVATPRSMGIHVLHTPRPARWQHIHGLRQKMALLQHRAIMRRAA